jgi:hypothetical protein
MARINIRENGTFVGWFDDEKSEQWHDGTSSQTLYRTTGTGKADSRRWVLRLWQGIPGYRFISDDEAHNWLDRRDIPLQEETSHGGRPEIGGRVVVRLGWRLAPVEALAADRGESRSDCIRHLIEVGLAVETTTRQEPA